MVYESYSEFIEFCDMARDKVDDWGKLDKKTKQRTLKKYALLKMKTSWGWAVPSSELTSAKFSKLQAMLTPAQI